MLHFDPVYLTELDREAIGRYHALPGLKDKYRLHIELGPHPYEGDIGNARVVVLMNNPGFDATSTPDDHRFHRAAWPYASLHPDAPVGMRCYSTSRFRDLITEFGAQHVSQRLAMLQIHPWASGELDTSKRLTLPSQQLAIAHARVAIARGTLVLIGRGAWYWLKVLGVTEREVFVHHAPRSAYWNRESVPPDVYEQMRARLA
ncbi:hypothetical protein VOI32_28730 [Paraburkholderia caribensis]|uniref:Uncharacterized protein n=1 Tax=Paraburkholderia caribensis TaxID=75105 RepID=A0A9Q6S641_9BURK|nr:hypothetical protein [Paraburkholderia caribensis]MCO4880519.1 hypothetical protein [Paraburkholderia caribensis]PTB23785.1 hypothetical protein C9I56_37435 [Paraburkholderia caribensis]QLB65500.1 hypothetical protein A9O66_24295 [Paraburkholderia caribensis]